MAHLFIFGDLKFCNVGSNVKIYSFTVIVFFWARKNFQKDDVCCYGNQCISSPSSFSPSFLIDYTVHSYWRLLCTGNLVSGYFN